MTSPHPGPRSPWAPRRALHAALTAILVVAGCGSSNDLTRAPSALRALEPAGPVAPPPLPSGRLPNTARPTRYALALVIDPTRDRFSGDVAIDVDVPAPTQAIVLHGRELTVVRVEAMVDGKHVAAQAGLRKAVGSKDAEELVLTLSRPIPAGKAQIRIAYTAPLGHSLAGLYRVKEGGAHYAFTQLEPMDARSMFPCFDEPGFKVPFEVKVTTPKGNLVVANSPEIERADADDGRSTAFTFAPTPPLPTYLIALAVGPLEIREAPKGPVPIRLVATKGKTRLGEIALETAVAMTDLLTKYFDRPYPYAKLDLLAVPEFSFGAMENAGLIAFREERILLDPASAPARARLTMAELVAHEIAHHWVGNLVTMQWWDDLWLNEGFATWMEAKIVDAWRPALGARIDALNAKGWVMGYDALDSARPVRQQVTTPNEAEEAFDGITYVKGASVIGMMESWLGEDVFRGGVRSYLKEHENGSATAADLFRALSKASGRELWPIAATFLEQPGVPLVRAELACAEGQSKDARVKLSQERYRPRRSTEAERRDQSWKIPLCVAYEGAPRGAPACGLLEGESTELALPGARCPKWIYPNAEENGYYRFALPADGIAALERARKSLDPRSRIGLCSGTWALVQSGDLGADVLLDLLAKMRTERHRLVLEQMIEILGDVSDVLIDDATRPAFRAYVSSILLPIAKELGWDARKADTDDQKLLRLSVLTALGTLADDAWMLAESDKRAAAFLEDPRSIDADTAAIALRVSSRRAGEGRIAELERAVQKAATPEDRVTAVTALGSFGDKALLRRGLDLMLTDAIKTQDGLYILRAASTWAESRPVLYGWLRERFPELKKKMPTALARFAEAFANVCDPEARREVASFFGDALKDVEGADRRLRQALETADLCIDLRARESARARKRLLSAGPAAGPK